MRLLVATNETQGNADDDYCWTTEGELVTLPFIECDCPDCGCQRGFAGLTSHRATTTAVVAERPDLTVDSYLDLIWRDVADGLRRHGVDPDDPELRAAVTADAVSLLMVARRAPIGTVVRRDSERIVTDR